VAAIAAIFIAGVLALIAFVVRSTTERNRASTRDISPGSPSSRPESLPGTR